MFVSFNYYQSLNQFMIKVIKEKNHFVLSYHKNYLDIKIFKNMIFGCIIMIHLYACFILINFIYFYLDFIGMLYCLKTEAKMDYFHQILYVRFLLYNLSFHLSVPQNYVSLEMHYYYLN